MSKKKRKVSRQPATLAPSRKMAQRTRQINPLIAGIVAITMVLALVITILPGVTSGSSSTSAAGGRQGITSAAAQRIQDLEARTRTAPDDIGALTQLGNEYFDTGQYGKAIDPYTQVLDKTPNNTNVRTDLGISYYYLGMVKDAVREYQKALEVEPNKVQTLSNLGIAYADLSPPDIDGAVTLWQKVIQLYPGTPDAKKAQELIDKYKK